MKSLLWKYKILAGAALLVGITFGLTGCQGTPIAPAIATVAAPLPPNDTPYLSPVSPTLSIAPTPTPTRTPLPTLDPPLQKTPAPLVSRTPVDGNDLPIRQPRSNIPTALPFTAVPTARAPQTPPTNSSPSSFNDGDLYVHVPPQANQHQPLRVLLVLHGMGARGDAFAQSVLSEADRYNWLVVAPTLPYRDYMEPNQIMEDDLWISYMLERLLDLLPSRLNLKLRQHVLVYGFSRGAQLAHRFALINPERVESVATMSAGTYTLSTAKSKDQVMMPFPYGIGDLEKLVGHSLDWESYKRISFWVAVGERDNQPTDVPRAFDPYLGKTRVERATAFAKSLSTLGIDAHLVVFPNTGHEVTAEMRKGALEFLHADELADHWND